MVDRIPKMNEEDIKESREALEKEGNMEDVGKKMEESGSQEERQPSPVPTSPCHNDSLANIVPPSEEELTKSLPSLIDKAEYLALQILIDKLSQAKDLTAPQITTIIMQLNDLKLSNEWNKKLANEIARKARLMAPPNSRNNPATKKLGSMAGHVQDVARVDKRSSKAKFELDIDLPEDDTAVA